MTTREGIVEIDTGAGLPEDFAINLFRKMKAIGVTPSIFTKPDTRITLASFTCGHCHATVYLAPSARPERPYCRACDSSLCVDCGAELQLTGMCRSRIREIERAIERAVLEAQRGLNSPIIVATR
jgi:hypothetical protein